MRIKINKSRKILTLEVAAKEEIVRKKEKDTISKVYDFFLSSQNQDVFDFLNFIHELGFNKESTQKIFFNAGPSVTFLSYVAGERIKILIGQAL